MNLRINIPVIKKTIFRLFLALACICQTPADGVAYSFRLNCARVGYQENPQSETWIISQSLAAVSRISEKQEPPRSIETIQMQDIEILAKEIRGWDPASNSRFQILLEDNIIVLEGYFLDCLRE